MENLTALWTHISSFLKGAKKDRAGDWGTSNVVVPVPVFWSVCFVCSKHVGFEGTFWSYLSCLRACAAAGP